ncbi:uncharacterized protein LOC121762215 [Salvia splendens]|uniref:uncharacterized protein LOC121762215 n=1 Tax=Salvia splendens TaxID=180675 RepID=UPI001C27AEC9|nr:uncharacterized protein LOC121762215 [Salvia splendens]
MVIARIGALSGQFSSSERLLRITVSQNAGSAAVLQRRFHLLLCYNKGSSEDSGWLVAGQIKESLGRVLQDYPLLAGRLRWCDADLEIVCTDSGTRMVETKAEMALDGFVKMEDKREDEAELVFWEDVLQHTPQFRKCPWAIIFNKNLKICLTYKIKLE